MVAKVQDILPIIQYKALAGQTVFPYPFPVFASGDIVVTVDSVTKSEGTDYTVSGVGLENGGDITFTSGLTLNNKVTIYRDMSFDRLADYQQNGDFLSSTVNDDFDRIVLMVQQLNEASARSLRFAPEDVSKATIIDTTQTGKLFGLDENGDLFYFSASSDVETDYKTYSGISSVIADASLVLNDRGRVQGVGDFEIVATNPSGYFKELAKGGLYVKPLGSMPNPILFGVDNTGAASSTELQNAVNFVEANGLSGLSFSAGTYKFSGITSTKVLHILGETSNSVQFVNATDGATMWTATYSGVSDKDKRNIVRFSDIEWLDTVTETGIAIITDDVFFLQFNRCYWRNFSNVRAVQLDETLWAEFNFCSTDRAEVRIKSVLTPHFSNIIRFQGGEYRNPTTTAIDIDRGDVVMLDSVTIEGDSGNTTSPTRGMSLTDVRMLTIDNMYMEFLRTGDSGMKLTRCSEVAIKRSLLGASSTEVPAIWLHDSENVEISEVSAAFFPLKTSGSISNVRVNRCRLEGRLDIADGNDVRFYDVIPASACIIPINPDFQSTTTMSPGEVGVALKNNYASSSFKQLDPTGTVSGATTATYNTTEGYLDNYSLQLDFTGAQSAVFGSMGTTDAANQGAIISFMAKADIDTRVSFTGSIFAAVGGDDVNVTTDWRRYFLFTNLSAAISGTSIGLIITSTETCQILIDDIQTAAYSSFSEAARIFSNFRHIQTSGTAINTLQQKSQRGINFLSLGKEDSTVISGGVITVDGSSVVVDTEASAATDDLDTINGVPNLGIIFIRPLSSSRTVVLKDGTGNLSLSGDISLDNVTDVACLVNVGGFLREFTSSNNGA